MDGEKGWDSSRPLRTLPSQIFTYFESALKTLYEEFKSGGMISLPHTDRYGQTFWRKQSINPEWYRGLYKEHRKKRKTPKMKVKRVIGISQRETRGKRRQDSFRKRNHKNNKRNHKVQTRINNNNCSPQAFNNCTFR
ncbi:MAG: hypothetical protein Q8P57_03185 [Candidatus Pacearchaeota archaeon]|nr:hypothetical protein [Candidatus Pacearchaeota archaeon]